MQLSFDLIVKGGKVVTPGKVVEGSVLVKDGKVSAVVEKDMMPHEVDAAEVIDASGKYVLPGMIDPHVHIGEPGQEEREDIPHATRAAAAGGVTTTVVMPNVIPCVNSAERLIEREKLFNEKSLVDYALYGGAGVELPENIVAQAEAGAVGYKSYIRAFNPDRKGLICRDAGDLYIMMKEVAKSGRTVAMHAEDDPLINVLIEELRAEGKVGFEDFIKSRPETTEVLAVVRLCEMAYYTGVRLSICHMSSPRAVEYVLEYQDMGADIVMETCPGYLMFSNEDTEKVGAYAQVVPPLREKEKSDQLWEMVEKGYIDYIGTDHAPGIPEEKEMGRKDIFTSGGGLPGLETALPWMLDELHNGRWDIQKVVELFSEKPARVFDMYPQKGCLASGSDADMVIVDLDAQMTFSQDDMYTKGKDASLMYDGITVKGVPQTTVVRGEVVMRDRQITGELGTGEWVTPE